MAPCEIGKLELRDELGRLGIALPINPPMTTLTQAEVLHLVTVLCHWLTEQEHISQA